MKWLTTKCYRLGTCSLGFLLLLVIEAYSQPLPGDFLGAVIAERLAVTPSDAIVGPDNHLYVASFTLDSVLRYDGETGEYIDTFVNNIDTPNGLDFGADGNLYVSSFWGKSVLQYDGTSGEFMGTFIADTTDTADFIYEIVFGPDGHLYAGQGSSRPAIVRYDGISGARIDTFAVTANVVTRPENLVFGPDGDMYISSGDVFRFDGATGELKETFIPSLRGGLLDPGKLFFGANNTIYVSSQDSKEVLRFDEETGAFLDVFVSTESGGLTIPGPILQGGDGSILVLEQESGKVLQYEASTGAFIGNFVDSSSEGIYYPTDMTLVEDSLLYLAFYSGVYRFNAGTGRFIDTLITPNQAGLTTINAMALGSDGNLYISHGLEDEVLRFDASNGAFVDIFIPHRTGGLSGPQTLRFGDDGLLYVLSSGSNEILRFDQDNGQFVDVFASLDRGGVVDPGDMLFSTDGHLYVSSFKGREGGIWRFDGQTGRFIDRFSEFPDSEQSNFFGERRILTEGPYGDIYAARSRGLEIYRINKTTGAASVFIPKRLGSLRWPTAMAFDSSGHLYVTSRGRQVVLRYAPPLPVRVSVDDAFASPGEPVIHQIYPNPVSTTATISYTLSRVARVEIILYDIQGRKIQRLEDGVKAAGDHQMSLDLQAYPSGLYFYHIRTPDTDQVGRFAVAR